MIKIHFGLLDKPDDPVPEVVDSKEDIAMWGVGLAALGGECNTKPTYSVENTAYIWNAKLRLKSIMSIFDKNF